MVSEVSVVMVIARALSFVAPIIISIERWRPMVVTMRKLFGVVAIAADHPEAYVNVYEPASSPLIGVSFDLAAYFNAKAEEGEQGLKMSLLRHLGQVFFGRGLISSADFYRPYCCCWL